MTEEFSKKMDIYLDKCEQKGFNFKYTEMVGMLALSDDADRIFGSTEKAFDYLLEIADKFDTSQDMLEHICDKLGIE